jgi:hypothetical protein
VARDTFIVTLFTFIANLKTVTIKKIKKIFYRDVRDVKTHTAANQQQQHSVYACAVTSLFIYMRGGQKISSHGV